MCHLIAGIISFVRSAIHIKFNKGENGYLVESAAICPNSNQENLFENSSWAKKCPTKGGLFYFDVLYSSLLHLPPLIFHCVGKYCM